MTGPATTPLTLRERLKWFLFARRLSLEKPLNIMFDKRYRVDTAGEAALVDAGVAPTDSGRGNNVYRSVWTSVFRKAMGALAIDHRRFTFIDYGSGKGKAMLLASAYPFKRIVGVEYSPILYEISVRNCRAYKSRWQRCNNLEPILADAINFVPPEESLVCHFFNPFDEQTMRVVLSKLRALSETADCEIYIICVNMRTIKENMNVLKDCEYLAPVRLGRKFAIMRLSHRSGV